MIANFLQKIWDNLTTDAYSICITEDGNRVPVLSFDSIIESSFTGTASTTSNPIESGFNVVDFKYNDSDTIHCKGVISKRGSIGFGGESYSLTGKNKGDLIKKTSETLQKLKSNMVLLSIQSRNGILHEDFTLETYNIDENSDNFSLFSVDMTFIQVPLIDNAQLNLKNANNKDTIDIGIVQAQSL